MKQSEESGPFVDKTFSAKENLQMLAAIDNGLLGECISTVGWSFHFNQLINKAIVYEDKLKANAGLLESENLINQLDQLLHPVAKNRSVECYNKGILDCINLIKKLRERVKG